MSGDGEKGGASGRATHEQSQQAVSAVPVGIPDAWEAKAFPVKILRNSTGEGGTTMIAGWVAGDWALDFRVWETPDFDVHLGWCLTHLPTGYIACGILAPLPEAQAIALEFAKAGEWGFTDPTAAKFLKSKVKAIRDRHDGKIVFRSADYAPFQFAPETPVHTPNTPDTQEPSHD